MEVRSAEQNERNIILSKNENHFLDFKSKRIDPAKLQITFVAFANTDGGELYIGIEDAKVGTDRIQGFNNQEEANDMLVTLLEQTEPSVENVDIEYVNFEKDGLVLHITVPKSTQVHYTAKKKCYIRLNASNRLINNERILALAYSKGSIQYENKILDDVEIEDIIESEYLSDFLRRIQSNMSVERFLKKQRLLRKQDEQYHPNVACILLFDEEPQATLDTRCSVKLYRLRTSGEEYDRKYLEGMPTTLRGCLEVLINQTLDAIDSMLENTLYKIDGEYERQKYPITSIKEIIVNALIHRDYSLNDDIHIMIYDDRIEIKSPGRLPGFVTVDNIYEERYSRNPKLVQMLHRLPEPPNHDIGEGLTTARNELRQVGLVEPFIEEKENSVVVTIKHQRIATIEQIIRDVFIGNPDAEITNKMIRDASGEDNINIVKKSLQNLRAKHYIEAKDENVSAFKFSYVIGQKGIDEWLDSTEQ